MVNQQLLQYIVQQEHAGYSESQIRLALQNSKYSQSDIDAVFRSLKGGKSDAIVHDYVEQYARGGYSGPETFSALQGMGYDAKTIRKALKDVYGTRTVSSDVPHTHIFIFSILALVLGAAIMFMVFTVFGDDDSAGTGGTIEPIITFEPQVIINDIVELARREGRDAGIAACEERLIQTNRDLCLQAVAVMREVEDPKVCTMIADIEVHDSCLINFLNEDFEGVCSQVKLARSKETCDSLRQLRG